MTGPWPISCVFTPWTTAQLHTLGLNIFEVHSEEWFRKRLMHLSDWENHKKGRQELGLCPPEYSEGTPFSNFPMVSGCVHQGCASRLPSLFSDDVYIRLHLEIYSTNNICWKLQGTAVDTASWATRIGNEREEVVHSILTTSEDTPTLKKLTDRLMEQYRRGGSSHLCCFTRRALPSTRLSSLEECKCISTCSTS